MFDSNGNRCLLFCQVNFYFSCPLRCLSPFSNQIIFLNSKMVLIIVATYSGGFLRPCSQSFNVATGIPNKSANFVWLNPVCVRISLIFINTTSFRFIIRRCLRLYKWNCRKRKSYQSSSQTTFQTAHHLLLSVFSVL